MWVGLQRVEHQRRGHIRTAGRYCSHVVRSTHAHTFKGRGQVLPAGGTLRVVVVSAPARESGRNGWLLARAGQGALLGCAPPPRLSVPPPPPHTHTDSDRGAAPGTPQHLLRLAVHHVCRTVHLPDLQVPACCMPRASPPLHAACRLLPAVSCLLPAVSCLPPLPAVSCLLLASLAGRCCLEGLLVGRCTAPPCTSTVAHNAPPPSLMQAAVLLPRVPCNPLCLPGGHQGGWVGPGGGPAPTWVVCTSTVALSPGWTGAGGAQRDLGRCDLPALGPLAAPRPAVLHDVKYYLAFIVLLVLGFATAFHILYRRDQEEHDVRGGWRVEEPRWSMQEPSSPSPPAPNPPHPSPNAVTRAHRSIRISAVPSSRCAPSWRATQT